MANDLVLTGRIFVIADGAGSDPGDFPAGRSGAVHALQIFFLCASVVSFFVRQWFHMPHVFPLFVSYLSFFCSLARAVLPDCGNSWFIHFQYCWIKTLPFVILSILTE